MADRPTSEKKMDRKLDPHPLRTYFRESVHQSLHDQIGLRDCDDLENYLTDMLVEFLHHEKIFAIQNAEGQRVESFAEMMAQGDVRLYADSFERERQVHRHIGDFLLFWSGLFPEMLQKLRGFASTAYEEEAMRQGSYSYGVVSSFDHAPYSLEAITFAKLSREFPACLYGLRLMRASFDGFKRQGWSDGFQA